MFEMFQESEVYEVEAILDKKVEGEKIKYFVTWTGYGPEENQWVFEEDMNCPNLIAEFWAKWV